MIYVPDYETYQCAYLNSSNMLRVYDSVPIHNTTVDYREYAIDNHYVYRDGSTTFSNYSTLPTCLDDDVITTNFYYRTDISDIVFLFMAFVGINYILISKLVKLFFRGSKVV